MKNKSHEKWDHQPFTVIIIIILCHTESSKTRKFLTNYKRLSTLAIGQDKQDNRRYTSDN